MNGCPIMDYCDYNVMCHELHGTRKLHGTRGRGKNEFYGLAYKKRLVHARSAYDYEPVPRPRVIFIDYGKRRRRLRY